MKLQSKLLQPDMKLLFDANLSYKLCIKLNPIFSECLHVDHVGLDRPPKDIDIWNHAANQNLIIVSNDEDFLHLANVKGFPPKVILLRTGNQSTDFIVNLLTSRKPEIEEFYHDDTLSVLELY